jgi:hypothetical protein
MKLPVEARKTGSPTDDDVVKRLAGYLVDRSEHEKEMKTAQVSANK